MEDHKTGDEQGTLIPTLLVACQFGLSPATKIHGRGVAIVLLRFAVAQCVNDIQGSKGLI